MSKEEILCKIEFIENKIDIYSEIDYERVKDLEKELWDLNYKLLDIMVENF